MAEIPRTRRRLARTPGLSPVTGAEATQAGFAQATQGLGDITGQLLERKRRLDTIDNNTWLINATNDYQSRARQLYVGDLLNRTGPDAAESINESAKFFKTISDEVAKNAPDDEYKNLAMQKISQLHNSYENKLIINQTKQVEQGNIDAIGVAADEEAENVFTNGGTVEAIEQGLVNMEDTINAFGAELGSDKVEELTKATTQHIANTAINKRMRVDPEATAADLEAGKYSKWITQEDREKHLDNARKEAKWQENQAEEAKTEAQDEVISEIVKDPSPQDIDRALESPLFDGDKEATTTLVKMKDVLITGQKKTTQNTQYANALNDPKLTEKSDMEIRSAVPDIEDSNKVIAYRDKVAKRTNGSTFDRILIHLEDDFDAGKFGSGIEGQEEYTKQLREYNSWAEANKDKDPLTDYYKPLMTPINSKWWSDKITEPDPIASREAIQYLRDRGKPITEDNIKAVVNAVKERDSGN